MVVSDENTPLLGRERQYVHVGLLCEVRDGRSLKIDSGLAANYGAHDHEIKIGVGLKANLHDSVRLHCSARIGQFLIKRRIGLPGRMTHFFVIGPLCCQILVDLLTIRQIERDGAIDLFQR